MKHAGKAAKAAWRLIGMALVVLLALLVGGLIGTVVGAFVATLSTLLCLLWIGFSLFTLYFFRDPDPLVPTAPEAIVAPAHGKVDVIDELTETEVMGGPCRRISIFLSIFNVHVQNAPIAGEVVLCKHNPGQFRNALKAESADYNENVLIGLRSAEKKDEMVGVRLIAGLIARRIVSWIAVGDQLGRGERISLIQFGSRVDLYLPPSTRVEVKPGDKVAGGQTIVATRTQ